MRSPGRIFLAEREKVEVEEEEKSEMEKLFKNMQVDTRDRSKLLGLALEASSGLKRELTTIEEVQKRVKKDAEEASAGNRWNRRAQRSYISNGNQSFNARSACSRSDISIPFTV